MDEAVAGDDWHGDSVSDTQSGEPDTRTVNEYMGTGRSGVVIEEAKCTLLGNEGGKYSLVGEMVVASDADSMYAMLTDYLASPRIFATVGNDGQCSTRHRTHFEP